MGGLVENSSCGRVVAEYSILEADGAVAFEPIDRLPGLAMR